MDIPEGWVTLQQLTIFLFLFFFLTFFLLLLFLLLFFLHLFRLCEIFSLGTALLGSHTSTELYGRWCFETEASLQAPGIHQCLLPATEVTKMCPDAWRFYTGSGD